LIKYNIGNAQKLRDLYLFSHFDFDSLKFGQIVAEFNLGFHDDLLIYCPTQEIISLVVTRFGLVDGGVPYFSTIFYCVSFFPD